MARIVGGGVCDCNARHCRKDGHGRWAKLNSITGLTDSFIEKGLKEGFFENPEKAYNDYVSKKLQESETDFNTKGPEKQPVPIATVDPNLNKFTGEQLMAYQEYLRRGYPPEMAEYLVTTLSWKKTLKSVR